MVDGTHFLQILHLTHHQVVLVLLVEAHGDCAGTSPIVKETLGMNNCQVYQLENLRWLSYKGIGTLYTNTKRTKQLLDFFFRDKGKGDHEASTTSNFKLHGFQTLLTGVFKRRLIPSDIRRYPGATSFVAFFALIDIFLTGRSSTASKDGLWSLKPSKLVNSRLVMLSRLSSDPVWKSFLGICYTASS